MSAINVEQQRFGSFVNGTNDGEACQKRWVAALVQINCEKKVASKLNILGIENYDPAQQDVRQWSDRKKILRKVIILMVVFVKIAPKDMESFRKYYYILKLFSYPGTKNLVTPIPDEQILSLKKLLENTSEQVDFTSTEIHMEDKVQISNGTLSGITGLVVKEKGKTFFIIQNRTTGLCKVPNRS